MIAFFYLKEESDKVNNKPKSTIELIKAEFVDDPLYIDCQLHEKTKDKLFPDFLSNINPELEYSVQDISEAVDRTEAAIRYYLVKLPGYIGAVKTASTYRLRYDSIYKIYLIKIYITELNKKVSDIKVRLGEQAQIVPDLDKRTRSINIQRDSVKDLQIDLIENLATSAAIHNNTALLEKIRSKINDIKFDLERYNSIQHHIKLLEAKHQAAVNELENAKLITKQLLVKSKIIELQNEQKTGFFQRIFKPVTVISEQDIQQPTEDEILQSDLVQNILSYKQQLKEMLENAIAERDEIKVISPEERKSLEEISRNLGEQHNRQVTELQTQLVDLLEKYQLDYDDEAINRIQNVFEKLSSPDKITDLEGQSKSLVHMKNN